MSFEALLARLDPRPDRRGREFERICAWYLQNAPEYGSQVRKVWLWNEWPGRWAADAGIDLVAETVAGDLWAIQAKAYDPAYAIKKSDVDSFLSESSRPQFAYRLLIATTDRVGHTARRTLSGQEKPAGLLLRSQLALAEVEWPRSPADLRSRPPKRKHPRPHQRKAVAAIVRGFEGADRGQLIMACGTGKTLAASFLAQKLGARRVLVLVPSLSLLAQTLREWSTAGEFSYLAVCSDETVTGEEDAIVASTTELGIPVTTDPATITAFLRRRGEGMRVVFATYQSSPRIAAAQKTRTPGFDLVIADEAHRCAGPEAGVFATILDAKKIKAAKRLFMTATPRFFTGRVRKEAREVDWEIASMDDESRFGPVLHRLSFAEAIEQELLSDYQVAVVGVSDATYREYAERGVFVTADGESVTDARTLASQLGLLRAMANYDLHRLVSFHSRIRNASTFARSLPDVCAWLPAGRRPKGMLWAEHVSGEMTSGERDLRLNRLRAIERPQRGVLTNARCLTEGVDVPSLDGVAFIEPRRSQVDVVQAVGRAIRKAADKSIGTVVIPVFVDEGGDPEKALDTGEFDRVWQILKALRAHDDVLADELDEIRRELGRRKASVSRPKKIHFDLPVGIGIEFSRAFDTRLVETTTPIWEFWFGLLQSFVEREGHPLVQDAHLEDGFRLGQWVGTQRTAYREGRLSEERVRRLAGLPGWQWNANDAAWEEGFSYLLRFVERERHALVPLSHIEDGYRLGAWVGKQRRTHRAGRLSEERIRRLAGLPGWQWDALDAAWEEAFRQLERFAEHEHHARVPDAYVEDGFGLGPWVRIQRAHYRAGRLSEERVRRLTDFPGWIWDALGLRTDELDAAWNDAFRQLERFVEREGYARLLLTHVEDGFRLGQWVGKQRTAYREGRLSEERVRRLAGLPGWQWNANDAAWEEGFSYLLRFVERERHALVPLSHIEDGYRLGSWVVNQRSRAERLSEERIRRLATLPGWQWNTLDASWEERFRQLERFAEREGHARVPQKHVEGGYRLGTWVGTQRHRALERPDRAVRLEALPGWAWKARSSAP